jgi:hypothetical protein
MVRRFQQIGGRRTASGTPRKVDRETEEMYNSMYKPEEVPYGQNGA